METPRLFVRAGLLCAPFVLCALWGCGSESLVCDPACPAGFHCETTGCVADNAATSDLAGALDSGASCNPPCSGATPWCNSAHVCVPCLLDTQCPLGQVCATVGQGSSCVPGCKDDSRCGATDGGAGSPSKCCSGQCIDTSADPDNCGACGKGCGSQHSSSTCAASACSAGACNPGWGDCNQNLADGCEANLHVDTANCTACGMACTFANAIAACSDSCYIAACNFGYDDCDGNAANGCETSVLTDPKNCGGCGMVCANVPHANVACQNANCAVTSCATGYLDCNDNPQDGCETAVATDVKNCGACNNACGANLACVNGACTCPQCNIPNSKTQCVNNVCVFASCVPGFADCNNNTADGCEVNLGSDPKNCGSCGDVCPVNTPSCGNGTCVVGFNFGPQHTFAGLTGSHYITQGNCSVNNGQGTIDQNAAYFCTHFYGTPMGLTCTPVPGYVVNTLTTCTDVKLHKNGGCTSNGNDIPNTVCDPNGNDSFCKIGNWNECTTGIANLVCHCQ